MANRLRRCCDCNQPIGNRDKFCARCGARQPRDPKLQSIEIAIHVGSIGVATEVARHMGAGP